MKKEVDGRQAKTVNSIACPYMRLRSEIYQRFGVELEEARQSATVEVMRRNRPHEVIHLMKSNVECKHIYDGKVYGKNNGMNHDASNYGVYERYCYRGEHTGGAVGGEDVCKVTVLR